MDSISGSPPDIPLCISLAGIVKQYKLKSHTFHFRSILKWKELELKWKQPQDMKALENYSEGVYSSILYLLLQVLGIKDVKADHVASHIGKALGITTLLRSTVFVAQDQYTFLPAVTCAKYGVTEEMIYEMKEIKEIQDVVYEIADYAKAHLDHAKKLEYPKEAYPVFLIAVLTDNFLAKLEKNNFAIMDPTSYKQESMLLKNAISILWKYLNKTWF
jgi:NADH dehydrogenase [ubiquinone] 1 alpha subcomplex assembly factor 6